MRIVLALTIAIGLILLLAAPAGGTPKVYVICLDAMRGDSLGGLTFPVGHPTIGGKNTVTWGIDRLGARAPTTPTRAAC